MSASSICTTRALSLLCVATAFVALGSCCREGKRDLRGSTVPSPDGKTYLAVDERQAPECVPFVDGKMWAHAIKAPGLVLPGTHTIDCRGPSAATGSAEIEFEIKSGTTFHFDYWGP